MSDEDQIIDLITSASRASELAKITVYRGFLNNDEVEITVSDRGEAAGAQRWDASARILGEQTPEELLRVQQGNPDATLRGALSNVHWKNLR